MQIPNRHHNSVYRETQKIKVVLFMSACLCMFKSDKVPTPPECKETPKPTSEATPDETVITIETETESKDDESTPSQYHWSVTYISKTYYQL